ncbi:MAG: N-formylglutamate amidohydrolase [Myxococcales bacterium]|nr:N-formylglutamate amidohydrolase [Myxococcales bacterium]
MTAWALLVSCEHASRRVPSSLEPAFAGAKAILDSHRGWDAGAVEVARRLSRRFAAPLIAGRYSRLVVDLNRSSHHPRLFSAWTRGLDERQRGWLLRLHAAHWQRVADQLAEISKQHGHVVHLAVHSFTPELDGERRNAEIGLLYDPRRPGERRLASLLRERLVASDCRVRRNYPYRGVADGLPTALRKRLGAGYQGLELELNQAFLARLGSAAVSARVADALRFALD